MKRKTDSILFYLPKVIVFGLALLNLFYVSSYLPDNSTGFSFCVVCPWYETSDFNYVTTILTASVFLLVNRRWSYLIAGALSGYIVGIAVFYLTFNMGLSERFWGIQRYEPSIFIAFEMQWILATIVFAITGFYLIQNIFRKSVSEKYV